MANRALLIGVDIVAPPTEYEPADALLGANYSIPLFWLSLFSVEDLTAWPSTLDGAATYTALIYARDECVRRSIERVGRWSDLWPSTIREVASLWLDFLNTDSSLFYGVWTADISEMTGDEEFAAELRSWLEDLDNEEAPGFRSAAAHSYLNLDPSGLAGPDGEPIGLVLAGFPWGSDAPWA